MAIPLAAFEDALTALGVAFLIPPVREVLRKSGWAQFLPADPAVRDADARAAVQADIEEAFRPKTEPPGPYTRDTIPGPPKLPGFE